MQQYADPNPVKPYKRVDTTPKPGSDNPTFGGGNAAGQPGYGPQGPGARMKPWGPTEWDRQG